MNHTSSTPTPRRLLGVWAHPDDEGYLSGGLMARVADAGGSVTVITATLGEQGTPDADLAGSNSFGERRRRELVASLAELGVTDLRLLGLGDGQLPEADAAAQVSAIAAVIDEVQPEVIVTFGPDGLTWHPDHQAVSAWTTMAWLETGRRADLLYASMTEEFAATHDELHTRIGLFDDWGPGHPATIPLAQAALECAMTPEELARKRRAMGCHASQIDVVVGLFGEEGYTQWLRQETFRRPSMADLPVGVLR